MTSKTDSHGEDYDFGSIMHYPLNAFAVNPDRQTLVPLQDLKGKVPYVKLSDSDVTQANKMYKCMYNLDNYRNIVPDIFYAVTPPPCHES